MKAATNLAELLQECSRYGHHSADYFQRMMHKLPEAKVVKRIDFIQHKCRGKSAVNFGSAWGTLHGDIKAVAKSVFGVDKVKPTDLLVDLDDVNMTLREIPAADVYVCGEIIEHLANPGFFLKKLREAMPKGAELIVTVPNALAEVFRMHALRGMLNVNEDHVAWYCPKTIETLLGRYGFEITERYYYEGRPVFAEGMIVVAR